MERANRVENCTHADVDYIGWQEGFGCEVGFPIYRCRGCGTTLGPERAARSRIHMPADDGGYIEIMDPTWKPGARNSLAARIVTAAVLAVLSGILVALVSIALWRSL